MPRHARKVSTNEYIKRLTTVAKVSVPGGKAMVMQTKIKGLRKLGEADIEVKIKGQEIDKLFDLARQTAEAMNQLQQFTNVYVSMDMTKPEYQILVDRTRAAELGVSVVDVATTTRSLVSGAVATRYREGDDFYNIRVMIPEKTSPPAGHREPGAELRPGRLPQAAGRGRGAPGRGAGGDRPRGPGEGGHCARGCGRGERRPGPDRTQNGHAKVPPPVGYEVSYGGQAQMMAEMKRTVLLILAFAVFFSFVVLAVQFNSLKLPALILGCVPFCLAGMIYAALPDRASHGSDGAHRGAGRGGFHG